jgi:CheY-like chemotaxis protein
VDDAVHAAKLENLGRLTSGVAHDLNNLLMVITAGLRVLRPEGAADGVERDAVQNAVERAAQHAKDLLQQLLALARREPAEPVQADLNFLIGEAALLAGQLADSLVTLEVVAHHRPLNALVAPGDVLQALLNLCRNACDAMPLGGRLTLSAEPAFIGPSDAAANSDRRIGSFIRLRVADTGTGIPPEVVARMFEPFVTTKPVGRGTGLGLSRVHDSVRNAGGWVECNTTVGRGTRFDLYFPAADVLERPAPSPPAHAPRATGQTVVLADDEPDIRLLARLMLSRQGYRVVEAEDAASTLAACRKSDVVRLVVLDQGLAGDTWPELLAEVTDAAPAAGVLIISGALSLPTPPALRSRVVGFLPKPFTVEHLLEAVAAAMNRPDLDPRPIVASGG